MNLLLALILSFSVALPIVRVGDSNTVISSGMFGDKEYYAMNGWSAYLAADDNEFSDYLKGKCGRSVFVMLGTNDIYEPAFSSYGRSLSVIIDKIRRCATPYLVMLPSFPNAQDKIDRLNGVMINVAVKTGTRFVYYYTEPSFAYDGIHQNEYGQRLIDAAINNSVGNR